MKQVMAGDLELERMLRLLFDWLLYEFCQARLLAILSILPVFASMAEEHAVDFVIVTVLLRL
jgi:hypothetical protein